MGDAQCRTGEEKSRTELDREDCGPGSLRAGEPSVSKGRKTKVCTEVSTDRQELPEVQEESGEGWVGQNPGWS